MIAGGKATLSLICSVTGGVRNMVLDYLLIAGFHMGIGGAAVATGLGYCVTAVVGLAVFFRKKGLLYFCKPVVRFKVLANAAANGCSEMATALVTGIITMMFNRTMLRYVGENRGGAAVPIIVYVLMFGSSLYTGYSYGVAPMLSFYYGERNEDKLKKMVKVSLRVILLISVITVAASFLLTEPLVSVFARPFVFMLITMIVLPRILGMNGIWLATPAAELMVFSLSAVTFLKYRKRYGY